MTPDEIRNLAIKCGMEIDLSDPMVYLFFPEELAAYTAAVEAPLQVRISQLEEALQHISGFDYARSATNGCAYKSHMISNEALNESPDTWLSKHDKEVEARERERCEKLHDTEDVLAPIGNSSYGECYQDGWIDGTSAYVKAIRASK